MKAISRKCGQKPVTQEQKSRMMELRDQGVDLRTIGRMLCLAASTVSKHTSVAARGNAISETEKERYLELVKKGYSQSRAAKAVGRSPAGLRLALGFQKTVIPQSNPAFFNVEQYSKSVVTI